MIETTILDITVSPKSSKTGIKLDDAGNIKVYLNSPPVDGRANAECIEILSKTLRIAKSHIIIDKGTKGRKKRIIIEGMSRVDVMAKIGQKT